VGLLFNNTDGGGLYVDLIARYSDGAEDRQTLAASLAANVDRSWSIEWDPLTGVLAGSLSGSDAGSASVTVDTAKAITLNAIGLWSGPTSPLSGNRDRSDWYADIFIDDVEYRVGVVPEGSSIVAWSIVVLFLAASMAVRQAFTRRSLRLYFVTS
jgi:hypothetical protein